MLAFDSPNIPPLAKVGISITENESLTLPPPRGRLKIHTRIETRVVTLKLIPGYDDAMISNLIAGNYANFKFDIHVLILIFLFKIIII